MPARRVALIVLGAIAGAIAQPAAMALVWLFDEGGYDAPMPVDILVTAIWYVLSIPGIPIAGHGYWTMSFVVLFLSLVGAWSAHRWTRLRMKTPTS